MTMKYPTKDPNGKLNPSSVTAYYNINNNEIFQTLAFLASNDDDIPSYSVIGRIFTTLKSNGQYILNKLESKFYTFGVDNQPSKPYEITAVEYNKQYSFPNRIIINIFVDRVDQPKPRDEPDNIYVPSVSEEIVINLGAEMNFVVSPPPKLGTPRPVNGGYECNGKAITSG